MIRLVISDIDGTLVPEGGLTLNPEYIDVVRALDAKGITFVAASGRQISTAATILLLIVGFIILYNICSPMSVFRSAVWAGCLVGCAVCCIYIPQLFAITGMSKKCIMLFVVFSIATEAVLRYLTKWIEGLEKLWKKVRYR